MDRRSFVATGAATLGGLLAGCSGTASEQANETTHSSGKTTTTQGSKQTTTARSSYTVEMAPVGTVTFESVPQKWSTYFPGYADMGVALGQADGLSAVGYKARYHTDHYDELDGVSVDKAGLTELLGDGGIDKALYYELGNDVHLTDPQWLVNNSYFGLEKKDVEQVESQTGPFVGNTIFRRTDTWHDYRYYTMYGAFRKVAEVFQKVDQYEAFKSLHDDVIASVQAELPPAKERPNGLLCFAASDQPETFSPYRISGKGTNKKHFHDLGVTDALAGTSVKGLSESNRSKIDYETMLKVDPDMLFVRGHETKTREEFRNTVVSFMEGHSVASQLTAVQNGDVYRGGPIYQGPVQNLFLTERFAKLLYPDTYSGTLFDRSKVSDVVTGEF